MQETSVHIVLSRVRTFDPGPRLCSPCGQYIQSLEFETVSGGRAARLSMELALPLNSKKIRY
jgi:hypothetical protein